MYVYAGKHADPVTAYAGRFVLNSLLLTLTLLFFHPFSDRKIAENKLEIAQ